MRHHKLGHWLGRRRIVDGQAFTVVDVRPHVCRGGRVVSLLVWRSRCREPACGCAFEFTTARKPNPFTPPSRCAEHHVSARKARRLARREVWAEIAAHRREAKRKAAAAVAEARFRAKCEADGVFG